VRLRVATLTDPDVPNSGIRLLKATDLLRADGRPHDLRSGKRVLLQQAGKALPAHASTLGAAVQPFPPQADDLPLHAAEPLLVARDPIIRLVPPQLLHQLLMLPGDRRMAMGAAPGVEGFP
jgi:hypothetical protein